MSISHQGPLKKKKIGLQLGWSRTYDQMKQVRIFCGGMEGEVSEDLPSLLCFLLVL